MKPSVLGLLAVSLLVLLSSPSPTRGLVTAERPAHTILPYRNIAALSVSANKVGKVEHRDERGRLTTLEYDTDPHPHVFSFDADSEGIQSLECGLNTMAVVISTSAPLLSHLQTHANPYLVGNAGWRCERSEKDERVHIPFYRKVMSITYSYPSAGQVKVTMLTSHARLEDLFRHLKTKFRSELNAGAASQVQHGEVVGEQGSETDEESQPTVDEQRGVVQENSNSGRHAPFTSLLEENCHRYRSSGDSWCANSGKYMVVDIHSLNNAYKQYVAGDPLKITWRSYGIPSYAKIGIRLYVDKEGFDKYMNIASGIPNTGSYTWYPPSNTDWSQVASTISRRNYIYVSACDNGSGGDCDHGWLGLGSWFASMTSHNDPCGRSCDFMIVHPANLNGLRYNLDPSTSGKDRAAVYRKHVWSGQITKYGATISGDVNCLNCWVDPHLTLYWGANYGGHITGDIDVEAYALYVEGRISGNLGLEATVSLQWGAEWRDSIGVPYFSVPLNLGKIPVSIRLGLTLHPEVRAQVQAELTTSLQFYFNTAQSGTQKWGVVRVKDGDQTIRYDGGSKSSWDTSFKQQTTFTARGEALVGVGIGIDAAIDVFGYGGSVEVDLYPYFNFTGEFKTGEHSCGDRPVRHLQINLQAEPSFKYKIPVMDKNRDEPHSVAGKPWTWWNAVDDRQCVGKCGTYEGVFTIEPIRHPIVKNVTAYMCPVGVGVLARQIDLSRCHTGAAVSLDQLAVSANPTETNLMLAIVEHHHDVNRRPTVLMNILYYINQTTCDLGMEMYLLDHPYGEKPNEYVNYEYSHAYEKPFKLRFSPNPNISPNSAWSSGFNFTALGYSSSAAGGVYYATSSEKTFGKDTITLIAIFASATGAVIAAILGFAWYQRTHRRNASLSDVTAQSNQDGNPPGALANKESPVDVEMEMQEISPAVNSRA